MTTSENLSIADAVLCGQWAKMAYSSGPFPLNFTLVDMRPKADVQCLVGQFPDSTVFAFRGTDDIPKWFEDAKIALTPVGQNGEKAHLGFTEGVRWIWPALAPLVPQDKPIITTGHSLGAALARQFTKRLADNRTRVAHSITFGEPRSFNRAGARAYNLLGIPTWRVIDEDDLVCRVPWRFGLYQHCGNSCFLDGWGNAAINEPWYAHLASDAYVLFRESKVRSSPLISDHFMDKYIARLAAAQARIEDGDL